MKQNYTLNICYGILFGILLAIFPVKNNSATVTSAKECKTMEKAEKPVLVESQEVLHSDLLFR